eukprot:scpid86456/ scgid27032/ 
METRDISRGHVPFVAVALMMAAMAATLPGVAAQNESMSGDAASETAVTTRFADSTDASSSPLKTSAIVTIAVGGMLLVLITLLFAVPYFMKAGAKTNIPTRERSGSKQELLGNEVTPPASPVANAEPDVEVHRATEQNNKPSPDAAKEVQMPEKPTRPKAMVRMQSDSALINMRQVSGQDKPQLGARKHSLKSLPEVPVVRPEGFDMPARRISATYESIVSKDPTTGGMTWDWPAFDQLGQSSLQNQTSAQVLSSSSITATV